MDPGPGFGLGTSAGCCIAHVLRWRDGSGHGERGEGLQAESLLEWLSVHIVSSLFSGSKAAMAVASAASCALSTQ